MTTAHINRIATAVPPFDVHQAFISFATGLLPEGTTRNLFKRMARLSRSNTGSRLSTRSPPTTADGKTQRTYMSRANSLPRPAA